MFRFILFSVAIMLPVLVSAIEAIIPNPPPLSAKQYILMDYHTGIILAKKEHEATSEPASLTKLMTAYVVYHALESGLIKLTDGVKISNEARYMPGSRMFVEQGSVVSVADLLKGIVIQSGNDASVALAEHVAHSEAGFTDMMNEQARRLGLKQSHFMNATGLPDDNHQMSAYDIAILSRALIRDFPQYYRMYSQKEFTYNNVKQNNRNRLLWRNQDVDGLKTGHTEVAGYCLAASARRGNMRLLAVVLGSSGDKLRFDDAMRLINYGFRFYETHRLYTANQPLYKTRVWHGEHKFVELGLEKDFYVVAPRNAKGNFQIEKIVQDSIDSPVSLNQELGLIKVGFMQDEVRQAPLVALSGVVEGNWMIRLRDSFLKLF